MKLKLKHGPALKLHRATPQASPESPFPISLTLTVEPPAGAAIYDVGSIQVTAILAPSILSCYTSSAAGSTVGGSVGEGGGPGSSREGGPGSSAGEGEVEGGSCAGLEVEVQSLELPAQLRAQMARHLLKLAMEAQVGADVQTAERGAGIGACAGGGGGWQ